MVFMGHALCTCMHYITSSGPGSGSGLDAGNTLALASITSTSTIAIGVGIMLFPLGQLNTWYIPSLAARIHVHKPSHHVPCKNTEYHLDTLQSSNL
jgi:hypothetical protein